MLAWVLRDQGCPRQATGTWVAQITRHFQTKRLPETPETQATLKALRAQLEETFVTSRRASIVLENRLVAYFKSDKPRRLWHQLWDRLTVRYYNQIDRLSQTILQDNAGDERSGLSPEELRDFKFLSDTFRRSLKELTMSIADEPFRRFR
jgi:hypothetical protein